VRDDGGGINVGVATVFHCTNFSGVLENIRLVTRSLFGVLVNDVVFTMAHLHTVSFATHNTGACFDRAIDTGEVAQGTMAIAATSVNIICTAMTIDAASFVPIGVALRGIRFNPVPGSQE